MKTYLLLITWFVGPTAVPYHVEFTSQEKCDKAKEVLIYDYAKNIGGPDIKLSIICVEK